jgi:hypothetical protein
MVRCSAVLGARALRKRPRSARLPSRDFSSAFSWEARGAVASGGAVFPCFSCAGLVEKAALCGAAFRDFALGGARRTAEPGAAQGGSPRASMRTPAQGRGKTVTRSAAFPGDGTRPAQPPRSPARGRSPRGPAPNTASQGRGKSVARSAAFLGRQSVPALNTRARGTERGAPPTQEQQPRSPTKGRSPRGPTSNTANQGRGKTVARSAAFPGDGARPAPVAAPPEGGALAA